MVDCLTPVRTILVTARIVLLIEYIMRVLWAPFSIACLFMALAAMDVLPALPPWLHAGIVAVFAAALAYRLRLGFLWHSPPTGNDVLRRVETDSGLKHRPFDVLDDRPVGGDDVSKKIWDLYKQRVSDHLRGLRVKLPHSNLAAHDAYAQRALVLILLTISLIVGGDHFGERLDAALSPPVLGTVAARNITLDAWVTPPDYTGLPPIVLKREEADDNIIEMPAGSVIEARVSGGSARPHIIVNGKRQKFQAIDRHDFQVSLPVQGGNKLTITQGWRTLANWKISVADQVAPVISWIQPPSAGKGWTTKLEYRAADQYGLADISATIALADEVKAQMLPKGTALDQPGAAQLVVQLPDAAAHPKSLKISSSVDWSANPWAGFPVNVTLTATGVSGQSSNTPSEALILPERIFTNQAARDIVAERKRLTLDPLGERASVAGKMAVLANNPDSFGDDPVVFLALQAAAMRLWETSDLAEIPTVQDLMWQAAIRIEDGAKGEAEKAVADAETALRQALARNAPQSEIAQLSRQLKAAMNRYLDALQKDLQDRLARGEPVPVIPRGMAGKLLNRNDLNQMVDKLNGLSQDGQRDAANELLSQLENTMHDLHAMDHNSANQKSVQAMQAMGELKKLADRQQALLDQTYGKSGSGKPDHNADSGAGEQQALKEGVEQQAKRLQDLGADVPGALNQAETDMGKAGEQLGKYKFNEAIPHETDALNNLRQSLQQMVDKMSREQSGMALSEGDDDEAGQNGKDPFGRSDEGNGRGDDGKIHVPDQSDQQKSREILDELRKRSGERFRAKTEHDYIDRLLRDY